jgi:hypothetical protein
MCSMDWQWSITKEGEDFGFHSTKHFRDEKECKEDCLKKLKIFRRLL